MKSQVSTDLPISGASAPVAFQEKLGYSAGDLGINLAFGAMASYVAFFYTDIIGISAAIVGTILLLSRVFDGVTDIIMGWIVDKTKSRHGKARPWILYFSVPFGVSLLLIFTVPNAGMTTQIIYAAVTYNLLMLVFTAISLPYGALTALMTQDQSERTSINVFRMFTAMIGLIIVNIAAVPMINVFGDDQRAWIIVFAIFATVGSALFLVTFKTTHERANIVEVAATQGGPAEGGFARFKVMARNKYWWLTIATILFWGIGDSTTMGSTIYYAQYILGDTTQSALLQTLLLVPGTVGLLFVMPLYRRFGKVTLMMVGAATFIVGSLFFMVDPSNLTVVVVASLIRGLGRVVIFGGIWAMVPDCVEYGEWRNGIRTEGMIYAGNTAAQKVGQGLGAALLGGILALGGYVGGAAVQTDSALTAVSSLFIFVPMIGYIGMFVTLLLFRPLERSYAQMIVELEDRRTAHAVGGEDE